MSRGQCPQALYFCLCEGVAVTGNTEPDLWDADGFTDSCIYCQRVVIGGGYRRCARHINRDNLMNAFTRIYCNGEGAAEGGAISLVGRIRPVALIFHFENVALKRDARVSIPRFVFDSADVEKRLVRRDEFREGAIFLTAIIVLDGDGLPGQIHWVQHAKPNAVALALAVGFAVHLKTDDAVRCAFDVGIPLEVDAERCIDVMRGVGDEERVVVLVNLYISQLYRHGSPVLIADGGVQAAHDLAIAAADVTQVTADVDCRQGASAQGASGSGGRRFSIVERVFIKHSKSLKESILYAI